MSQVESKEEKLPLLSSNSWHVLGLKLEEFVMKIVRTLFLIGGLGLLFASCGAHKGGTCPAYKTDAGSSVNLDEVAANDAILSEDLN